MAGRAHGVLLVRATVVVGVGIRLTVGLSGMQACTTVTP